jgi:hypothetical protein
MFDINVFGYLFRLRLTISQKFEEVSLIPRYPDILPKDTLPKDILPNGHFDDGRFAEQMFCRTVILPNRQFAERTTCRK